MPINKQKIDVNKMLFHQEFHSSSKTKQKNTRKIHHYFFFLRKWKTKRRNLSNAEEFVLSKICDQKSKTLHVGWRSQTN